jgi:hypothetical protein
MQATVHAHSTGLCRIQHFNMKMGKIEFRTILHCEMLVLFREKKHIVHEKKVIAYTITRKIEFLKVNHNKIVTSECHRQDRKGQI